MRSARFDIPGGPIAAVQAGDPGHTAVLLVPGFTGSKEDFVPVLEDIAEAGFFVTAIDQRGQYESPPLLDESAYSVAALANDLLALTHLISEERVHLLGHSFGGLVVRAAAIAAPSEFRSLTLMGSGPSALGGPRRERLDLLAPILAKDGIEEVRARIDAAEAVDPVLAARPAEVIEFERQRFLASSPAMLLGMGESLRTEPDRVDELAVTELPMLVLHGVDDDAWSPAIQADMAARLRAEHVVILAAAHAPAEQNPADTARALIDFWNRVNV